MVNPKFLYKFQNIVYDSFSSSLPIFYYNVSLYDAITINSEDSLKLTENNIKSFIHIIDIVFIK